MDKTTATKTVETLHKAFMKRFGSAPDMSVFDHTHEETEEGTWVIVAEGWYPPDASYWAYSSVIKNTKVKGVSMESYTHYAVLLSDA